VGSSPQLVLDNELSEKMENYVKEKMSYELGERKVASEIYKKCLINRGIVNDYSDDSWMLHDEFDAVIDAIVDYAHS